MSFISYAQNFEDVMLWRALKHIKNGFYIDVGANDPDVESVTKAFYEQGWRGINIEPVSQWFEKIKQKRTRDINLNIAAGAQEGKLILYEIPDTGLSTSEKGTAERHKKDRGYEILESYVPVKTLTQICQTYHEGPIHFLSIDVEGAEKDVLQGMNLVALRPWIIVVESTLPLTQIENYGKWEELLTNSDYEFVYFDGLNRFYIAKERSELKVAFNAPPNIFDDFIRYQQLCSETRALQAGEQAEQAERRASKAQAQADQQANELKDLREQLTHQHAHSQWLQNEWDAAKAKVDELNHSSHHWWTVADQSNQELKAVYASWSWRITWPLRKLLDVIKWTVKMPMSFVKWIVAKAMAFAIKRDTLRLKLLGQVNKYPRLKARLNTIGQEGGVLPQDTVPVEGTNQPLQDLNNIPKYTEQPSSDIDTLKKPDDKNYIQPSEVNMKADREDIGRKLRGIIEEIGREL